MARTQSSDYSKIRTKILRKAAALFARKGYNRTTIEDLATATTSSRGALYHYFASKEAILFEIIAGRVIEMTEHVQRAMDVPAEPPQRCANVIRAIIALNTSSQNETIVLMSDQQYLSKSERSEITRLQNVIVDCVMQVLADADGTGRMTQARGKACAMTLFGMTNFIYTWYDSKGPLSPEELADLVVSLFLDGFLAAGDAS